jgi:hypothetical protein
MIRQDEIFFHILEKPAAAVPAEPVPKP